MHNSSIQYKGSSRTKDLAIAHSKTQAARWRPGTGRAKINAGGKNLDCSNGSARFLAFLSVKPYGNATRYEANRSVVRRTE